MGDVNFLEYGNNALRVVTSATDTASFLGDNGELVGVTIALLIILFLLGLVFVLGWIFIFKPLLTGKR
jgi:hypothetical protein